MHPRSRSGRTAPRPRRWTDLNPSPWLRLEQLEAREVPALVAAYGFDENAGTTLTDRSGDGLTGTISNATWAATGKYGSALSFNGTNSWVTVADSALLHLTTGMTLEAWVKPTLVDSWEAVLIKEATNDLTYGLYSDNFGNDVNGPKRPGIYIKQGGATYSTLGTAQVALNAWTHLAATYDGANLRLFVNGVQASSKARTGPLNTSTNPLRIGGDSVWSEWFDGLIDEVRVYNTALTATQIQTDMNTPINGTPDTTPPTVSVTAPADGATVSGAVTASAAASDNVGVVGVQFYLDGTTAIGSEDTAAPYSVPWNTAAVANGAHQLTAVARDAAGNKTTSAVSNVTVANDSAPPTVSVTAPAGGATVTGSAVAVSADAADNVGVVGVQFLLDGANLGAEDTTAPYSITWDSTAAANGSHQIAAVARDAAGNKTTAAAVGVAVANVDATPPTVSVTAPADGATVSGSAVAVTAGASDNVGVVGVQFFLDGTTAIGSEDTTSPYSVSWNTTAAGNGGHQLTAVARDAAGNSTTSAVVNVTVSNDITPPTVSVTAPADGATVSGSVAVSAGASDNVGVVGVQFFLDGTTAIGSEDTTSPYSVSWNTTAVANGAHQLTAVARDAAGNKTTSAVSNVTVANADTVAPTVSLTAPANGATVSNSVTVSANASDNLGVVGVQFLLDGNPLGDEDTASPFSITWDTTTAANGAHTLAARARDAAGNTTTSTTRAVTVSNAITDPAVVGQWSSVLNNWPLVAINAVLLDTGKVLMWDGGPDCLGAISATVWDPATNTFTPTPSEPIQEYRDIFCSSQTVLADGRVLVTGGHDCTSGTYIGAAISEIFDPATQTWTDGPDMAYRRWYPTAITLPNGKALVVAGSATGNTDYQPIPEVYDPVTNAFTTLPGASKTIPNYVYVFQLPDGRVLAAGSDEAKMGTFALDVASQTWTTVDATVLDAGSAVMYAPGKIMKAGSSYLPAPADNGGNVPSVATTYVLDTTQGTQTWQQTASMAYARTHLNLTVLPDGSVLATGGSSVIGGIDPATGVLPAELWNPVTKAWTTMAGEARAREYHSTALLLPDGRVLVAGSGHNYANSYAEFSGEIYSPPYLFKGARPTITSAPDTLAYGSSFFVGTPDGASIASVSLIRNGAVTHSFNTDQQFIPLSFTQTTGGLTVTAPPDANTAPPGAYMLYVVNGNGVPSVAPFVRLSGDSQPPTAPSNLTAARSGNAVTLNWTASTDNVGVARYNVYRSTTANFTPSAANKIGQTTATTYADPNLSSGTYYYKVTATDTGSNVSAASNQASITVLVSAIQVVQKRATGNENNLSQLSLAFQTAVTAGDFLIITGTAARPRTTLTITDTAGNTFVPAISAVSDPNQDVTAYLWYVVNARGGADTFTITPANGSAALEIHISEWSGVNKVNPLDRTSTAAGSGTSFTSGTVTTTQAGELIFGYTFPNGNSSTGAGFTQLSYINGDQDEYQIQSAAGPIAATFTQSPSDFWFALAATFRPDYGDVQPPSPPSGLTATAASDSTIALSWGAATDDVGVAGYDVYRSTASGFAPLPSNLIGSTTGTTYTDAGLPAGTFYYRVVARDLAGNAGTPSNEASAGVAGDTTAPTVSVTSPASGATVSGSVAVSATAADDVAVVGVQFLLDGNPLGAEDTTVPYSVTWVSAGATNGTHTLSARARDAAGNVTASAGVNVTVSNTAVPGLVAAYGFEEGSGTTVGDSSPNGLNGAISGATWVTTGKFGKALSFNGANSWVTVLDNNLLDLTTGMTLEAWVKLSVIDGWETVILKEASNDLTYGLYADNFGNDTGGPRRPGLYIRQGSTTTSALGTSQLAVGTWTHLAATYDAANLRLYVNGALVSTKAKTGALNTSTGPLRFGGDSIWSEWFSGLIDEIRVYNRALSAAEIQTDMNAPVIPGSPQLAAEGALPGGSAPVLTAADLAPVAAEAVRRWEATGLTPAQSTLLSRVSFGITDLNSRGELGETVIGSPFVLLDDDGAGRGWFVDPTPRDDAEFGAARRPAGYDLLTVAMHEVGHVLGLDDLDPAAAPDDLMAATLPTGTRRNPAPAAGAADRVAPVGIDLSAGIGLPGQAAGPARPATPVPPSAVSVPPAGRPGAFAAPDFVPAFGTAGGPAPAPPAVAGREAAPPIAVRPETTTGFAPAAARLDRDAAGGDDAISARRGDPFDDDLFPWVG